MSILRSKLLNIQLIAYRKNLQTIKEGLSTNASVARYEGEYNKNLLEYENISSKSELIRRILSSDIVYHGDYHPLRQSQRSVFRILRDIASKRKIIVCLEMFQGSDQRIINDFMHNRISLKYFLKKVNYTNSWGYNWENWQPIIDLCKEKSIPVLGINSRQENKYKSLILRDIYSAKIISKACIQNSESLIYVVDGDYHIAPRHLPHQVEKLLKLFDVELKRTIVYQNAESLYWQLARRHIEDVDVLQVTQDSFCIMNTTPANKLQSYINWLDYSEDAYYPVQAEWADSFEKSGNTSIPMLTQTICNILGMPYPKEGMDRLEIYYGSNLDFLEAFEDLFEFQKILPVIQQKIKNNEGFLLEYERNCVNSYLIYLPISSLNMAAEESAHLLNAIYRGKITVNLKPFDSFYVTVLTEMLGFFGSKLINEKRKALTQNAIRRYLGSFKKKNPTQEDKKKIPLCRLILQHFYVEGISRNPGDFKKKFDTIYRKHTRITQEFATQLGYMLGDKLFYAVKKGRFPLKELVQLFKRQFTQPFEAFNTYLNISSQVASKKHKKTSH